MEPPQLLYGTAWKEADTESLVVEALTAGFRGIDTANQRKHYFEAAVGAALARSGVPRDQVFLQTKFTFLPGQDERLPYDPRASIGDQVQQSFASSLEHLGVDHIDSYVLHGPSRRDGLGPADHQAWEAMQALHDAGGVGMLGVSNVSAHQLAELCDKRVPPAMCQNRCYHQLGWDRAVRQVCAEHGVRYQGFSLLTANRHVWGAPEVASIAASHGVTPAQVLLRLALHLDMIVLTGTTDPQHMREDLAITGFALTPDQIALLS